MGWRLFFIFSGTLGPCLIRCDLRKIRKCGISSMSEFILNLYPSGILYVIYKEMAALLVF